MLSKRSLGTFPNLTDVALKFEYNLEEAREEETDEPKKKKRRNKKLKDDEVVRMRKVRVKIVAHEDDWEATNANRKEMINELLNRMFGNYRFLYNSCVKLDREGQINGASTKEKDKWRIKLTTKPAMEERPWLKDLPNHGRQNAVFEFFNFVFETSCYGSEEE